MLIIDEVKIGKEIIYRSQLTVLSSQYFNESSQTPSNSIPELIICYPALNTKQTRKLYVTSIK